MAKVGMWQRDVKRRQKAARDAEKRAELKKMVKDSNLDFDARMEARDKLNKMERNGSQVRTKNRCQLTGRPRGFLRQFGLSRVVLRELASKGKLPGVTKASW